MQSSRVPTSVRILKGAALGLTALYLAHAFTAGHDNIVRNPNLDGPSYSEQLAEQHGCVDPDGALPSAAIATFDGDVAARYITDPTELDKAFRAALGEDVPGVYSVAFLCK